MYPNYPNSNQGQYPYPNQQGFPSPNQQGYPPQPGMYPPQPGFSPPQPGMYPPQPGFGSPTQSSPYPMPGGYQNPPQGGYPPQGGMPMYQNPGMPMYPNVPFGAGAPPTMQQGFPPQQEYFSQQQAPQMHSMPPAASGGAVPQSQPKGRPTITPTPNFDAANDAAILRKAMKGFGTDEDAIINVLCRRTNHERLEIAKAFKTAYGKDLIENIKKETSGNFEKVCVSLLKPMHQYYAESLYNAMEGMGTEEDVLIEVLCGLSNREVQAVTLAFKQLYGTSLEDALKSETSHCFKRILVSLSTGNRDESGVTNLASAQQDAQCLKNAGIGRMGTDESEFNRILCLRNNAQICLIAQEYEKLTGHTLEKDIKREFSGDVETAMVSVLRCALNKPLFFAKRINKAVRGFGTDDASLIRLIITRAEVDMMDIKQEYHKKFNESLKDAVKGDTSGHYRHALYALIGESK